MLGQNWDATVLAASYSGPTLDILIDQGTITILRPLAKSYGSDSCGSSRSGLEDNFYPEQLLTENFEEVGSCLLRIFYCLRSFAIVIQFLGV